MFVEDINRKINGVVKVDEDENKVLEQELNEYVITRELKRHFADFFNTYAEAFDEPTADTGVWISGFFGSGKSHFLKMLSYLLENKEVNGIRTVERFRKKFEDDPGTFMQVDRATKGETETILFNIDYEGSINKDKTAVLRVFAKVFYNHLGFFGNNLKVAMLEQYITQQGKMDEFCRLIEEKKGKPWTEVRKAFAFNGKFIKPALAEALDISEEDANNWFNDKSATELSVSQLVEDINAYVSTKPANFRLLFMVDEAGQYVGTDTDMLLNLQSLVEKIGSECRGKVWVVCTGQEAIDEIIKVRADEFSRIQARFKTRLSLSSSSVDEVIQKRILKKTPEAEKTLDAVYEQENSGMRNLFSFTNAMPDIKGFSGPAQFAEDFPFVPYQFLIMQKIFVEIRKHGNAGKHFSGGERSMLSGFQEAAQKVEKQNEFALVPLFRFYDTVHSFLDGSIRNVIDRCSKAVENHDGLEPMDVDVLKLLYLIRYVNEDMPANLDNLVILMADDIRLEKVAMREKLRGSLDRLMGQNYIGRTGDTYNFLTDEEQDIQKEINLTQVDTGAIVGDIAKIIFGIIYDAKKFRYGKCDFPFDQMVDNTMYGIATGGMRLRFLTAASDATEKTEFRLMNSSKGSEAIVVLGDTPYYESLEASMKIRKYVKQRNVSQLPESIQDIIRKRQQQARILEERARSYIEKAIVGAKVIVHGEVMDIKTGNAKDKLDAAMNGLVESVYSKLNMVNRFVESDADILSILNGADDGQIAFNGQGANNEDALNEISQWLELQNQKMLSTSMGDVQRRYQAIPYGWREIDIAALIARLISQQKISIKYGGALVGKDERRLVDYLRKKSEIDKAVVTRRIAPSEDLMRKSIAFLRDYLGAMDIPSDEDGLIRFVLDTFTQKQEHYQELLDKAYSEFRYPEKEVVAKARDLMNDVLSQRRDNVALLTRMVQRQEDLLDCSEDMEGVEFFFKSQRSVYDEARRQMERVNKERDYFASDADTLEVFHTIATILAQPKPYDRIGELPELIQRVKTAYSGLLDLKKDEVAENIRQCMQDVHQLATEARDAGVLLRQADDYFVGKREAAKNASSLTELDAMITQLLTYKDNICRRMEVMSASHQERITPVGTGTAQPAPKMPKITTLRRYDLCSVKRLQSKEDIDRYVDGIREKLLKTLESCDGVQIN